MYNKRYNQFSENSINDSIKKKGYFLLLKNQNAVSFSINNKITILFFVNKID